MVHVASIVNSPHLDSDSRPIFGGRDRESWVLGTGVVRARAARIFRATPEQAPAVG